jgi:hypothetical protein
MEKCRSRPNLEEGIQSIDVVGTVHERIECLAAQEKLKKLGEEVKHLFAEVFSPIQHINKLPKDVYCHIL